MDGSEEVVAEDGSVSNLRRNLETGELYDPGPGERSVPGVPKGGVPRPIGRPQINATNLQGAPIQEDLRVKIRVPPKYFTKFTSGPQNEIVNLRGIIFPYTPQISYELKADYSPSTPLHSNFPINFYQRSTVGNISIQGKFTVENRTDASLYLATVHLIRSLTRMRSGGATGDEDSGAPPPVCRLDAYGPMMLKNVPVVISNFRVELPDGVDYFTIPDSVSGVGNNSVPTVSTIAITCVPMYSRQEMLEFNVTRYLSDGSYRDRGII